MVNYLSLFDGMGMSLHLFFGLSGVRQGGILSPILFNLNVNTILFTIGKLDLGCHVYNIFLGFIMYADDFLLISASVINNNNNIVHLY